MALRRLAFKVAIGTSIVGPCVGYCAVLIDDIGRLETLYNVSTTDLDYRTSRRWNGATHETDEDKERYAYLDGTMNCLKTAKPFRWRGCVKDCKYYTVLKK